MSLFCLANSKKLSERCTAGVRVDTGDWIRPKRREKHGELTLSQIDLANGGDPQLLDLLRVSPAEHVSVQNRRENKRIQRLRRKWYPGRHGVTMPSFSRLCRLAMPSYLETLQTG
jgi:hypothetical protein